MKRPSTTLSSLNESKPNTTTASTKLSFWKTSLPRFSFSKEKASGTGTYGNNKKMTMDRIFEHGLVPAKYLKRNQGNVAQNDSDSVSSVSIGSLGNAVTMQMPQKSRAAPTSFATAETASQSVASSFRDAAATPASPPPTSEWQLLRRDFSSSLVRKQRDLARYESSASSTYVQEWKDTCLRAEGYQVSKAVLRFLHQWRVKAELFGTPDLKVTISDLAPNLVQAGPIQLVPTRDLAGRTIVWMHFDPNSYAKFESEWKKYIFYMLSSAVEDKATQDQGLVLLVWNSKWESAQAWGGIFDPFWSLWKYLRNVFAIQRMHYCATWDHDHSQSAIETPFSTKEYEEGITTIRHHKGSPQECLHACLTFGIPIPALPISTAAFGPPTMTVDFHRKWVEWRHKTDSYHHQHYWKIILVPNQTDVLFGKHKTANPGNIRFHQVLLSHLMAYKKATHQERGDMVSEVYGEILREGGTCLQPLEPKEGILWEPMEAKSAQKKISDAFVFLLHQLEKSERVKRGERSPASITDFRDMSDIFLVKQCFYFLNCQDGYPSFCGIDASNPPWKN